MSMFPGAGAQVYRNEAGEPIGWDYSSEPDPNEWADEYDAYDPDGDEGDGWTETEGYNGPEDFGFFGDEALCGE